mmetsp:Transcript_3373/g.7441  ORF Transcript_3373/g.7441 Transcript_3373/m.7441 type:complete len:161 (+) Transcript_3373:2-484(+)
MAYGVLSLTLPHVNLKESTWCFILDEVRFQTEHAVRDYYLSTHRPSTIAMASIFNTLDQVDQQDRQDILYALLSVVNQQFDSPEHLMVAKNRLQGLVGGNAIIDEEDTAIVSVSSRSSCETEAYSPQRGMKESFDEQDDSTIDPGASPHDFDYYCHENFF